jgi:ornithine decarboxylase
MKDLHFLKVDCASPGEMALVKRAGFKSSDILYANTMKSDADLEEALDQGFHATTTDSVEGVDQLATFFKSSEEKPVIVRLAVDDRQSRSPFSIKFGAVEREWRPIVDAIRSHGLKLGGVSFHVGSASADPHAFPNAIHQCKLFQQRIGYDLDVVDIGGGFLPQEDVFYRTAEGIRKEMEAWTDGAPKQWIAEPGRFFSSPLQTLVCPLVFKKDGPLRTRYLLDDSVYAQFSGILFDHARPAWRVLSNRPLLRTDKQALFFGKTCDSLDLIAVQNEAPDYEVGDIFVFPLMGAYTSASATTFNGFPLPQKYYLEDERFVAHHCLQQLFTEVLEVPGVEYPIETKSSIALSVA